MEAALRFCQQQDYLKVTLDTFMEREPAVSLFEKFRFHPGRTKRVEGKELVYFYLDLYGTDDARGGTTTRRMLVRMNVNHRADRGAPLPCPGPNCSPTPIPISPTAHPSRRSERSSGRWRASFPADYRAFLQESDGGALDDGRVVFYSVRSTVDGETRPRRTRRYGAANLSQPAKRRWC